MHRILQTANSDYYMIDDQCVAVRTRTGNHWSKDHSAVGARLVGSIRRGGLVSFVPEAAQLQARLVFSNDVLTSPVRAIDLPSPAQRIA